MKKAGLGLFCYKDKRFGLTIFKVRKKIIYSILDRKEIIIEKYNSKSKNLFFTYFIIYSIDISLFRELGNINRMLGNLIVGNPIRGARNR